MQELQVGVSAKALGRSELYWKKMHNVYSEWVGTIRQVFPDISIGHTEYHAHSELLNRMQSCRR
jgi:fido (protein-threonine AMPylation protein)